MSVNGQKRELIAITKVFNGYEPLQLMQQLDKQQLVRIFYKLIPIIAGRYASG